MESKCAMPTLVLTPTKKKSPKIRPDDGSGSILGWDSQVVLFNDDENTFEHVIDCQTHSDHMEHFGAAFMPREEYLRRLESTVAAGHEINWLSVGVSTGS